MATIIKHGNKWRAQICVNRKRASKVFATKQAAARWALEMEAGMGSKYAGTESFADAVRVYQQTVSVEHKGELWEAKRLKAWKCLPFYASRLVDITGRDIALWRDLRCKAVKPGTVVREMSLMQSVFRTAVEREWIAANPCKGVKRPKLPTARKRGVSDDEIARVVRAFGIETLKGDKARNRVGLAFLFAIETGMRSGEILALTRWTVDREACVARLMDTKNGDRREVPLSSRAIEILDALDPNQPTLFNLTNVQRDSNWRRWNPIEGMTFHDSRSGAITRLAKRLTVLELARAIGHRNINELMTYYAPDASELAAKLSAVPDRKAK